MVNSIKQRMEKLRRVMQEKELDAFLITKAENIFYLSGFTGGSDARLLIDAREAIILTDGRYLEQAEHECPGWTIIEEKPPGWGELSRLARRIEKLGFEAHDISYQVYSQLEQTLPSELMPQENMVEMLRAYKEPGELHRLRESARIGDEVFRELLGHIRAGASEAQLARQISFLLREKGCSKESFDTIVLAGEHAALPHGHPGQRLLAEGDMLTMDFGGFFEFYAGDMTRTVAVGKASERFQTLYRVLLDAQMAALDTVKNGVEARQVDRAARDVLQKADLESYFKHSTGHGLGLEIHEYPSLSQRSGAVLYENMVVTIEPGIYIPGWGGIRIEDTVVVQSNGCEIITRSDKGLLIV